MFQEAGEEANECALASTIGAEKGQPLPAVHGKGDFCECFLGAVAVGNVGKVKLMVNVAHGVRSQWNSISSVISPKPQTV